MLPEKTIYCARSGLPLAKVTALCSQGWPFLNTMSGQMIHPLYDLELGVLIHRLKDRESKAQEVGWMLEDSHIKDIAVCMSAIMYRLDAMWMPPSSDSFHKIEPSLPGTSVVVGSAKRLADLASWYHFATSKRMSFPIYRTSKKNSNLGWENFKDWLDTAWLIRDEWEKGRSESERLSLLKKREEALQTVKGEDIYKRIDFQKVWNWIEIQLAAAPQYPAGRRETFKSLFMRGDLSPEDWTTDDVEDLQFAITECCDIGNEITFFINKRLNGIKAGISDFYGSFTLITRVAGSVNPEETPEEREKTAQFFSDYDSRAANLEELPPEPKRESFASMAKFIQAQAQWRILSRRYEVLRAQQSQQQSINNPKV